MLKLKFKDFWNKLNEDQLVNYHATVHCMIDSKGFTFVMKSREKWEYYTEMSFELINRYAEEDGTDPLNAIDMFIINYCTNTLPILSDEEEKEIEQEKEEPHTEIDNEELTKNLEIDAGDDIVDEAKDYSDFLLKFFDKFEKKVLSAVNDINLEKSLNKNFGAFLTTLFNTVNSITFAKHIRKFIKADLIAGLVSAENELSIDIGFTDEYQTKLNVLASQQLDGYLINGKKWPGIKGLTKKLQSKVIKTVQDGLNENKSTEQIKEDIKQSFNNFSEARSEAVGRTETNRILSEGKLLGYKESGLKGKKVWSAVFDNRTSDICKRLNGQAVELDDLFIDPGTNKSYMTPPSHVMCRCSIFFRPN